MIGKRIGHYRIEEKIGEGGMGEVYRAHDESLDRTVALKVISTRVLAQTSMRAQFKSEALALSRLCTPSN